MKFYQKPAFLLVYYIVLVVVALMVLLLLISVHSEEEEKIINNNIYEGFDDSPQIQSMPIVKDEEILEAQEELAIERDIIFLEDGSVKIFAYLTNVASIEDDVVLQDFVEEIKFNKHVEILESNVDAKNGFIFPASSKIEIANYGPGPVSEKNTKFNVVLLDLNFTNDTENVELYELSFPPSVDIDSLFFTGTEFRFDKYILELDEYEYVL